MTISPAEDAHVKRSQLINDYLQESRAIEKDLKKKKLPSKQKEQLEQRLESLREEHTKRLAEFDDAQGIVKASRHTEEVKEDTSKPPSAGPAADVIYEERSWGSLSKRELEEECQKRGLSRKGGKEDLVSRLTIFTLDQKAKQAKASGGVAPTPAKAEAPKTIKYETVTASGPSTKQDYRNKNKKLWKRRGPPKAQRKMSSSSSSQEGDSASSDEDGEGAATAAPEQLDEERQKQIKREQLVRNVLVSILKKYNKGIPVQEMPTYLEKFKIVNFSPAALGYQSVEEWICNQPKDVLHVDKKSLLVYPPRVGEMPSSSDEESDSDGESDSGSSEKSSD